MIAFLRHLRALCRDTSANAVVLSAFALFAMVGGAGLATDTVQWTLWKRQLQRMADSAAISAAYAAARGGDSAALRSAATAELNRYTNITYTITDIPAASGTYAGPSTGPFVGNTRAVRIALSTSRTLPFSSMIMSWNSGASTWTPTISANATASAVGFGEYCAVATETASATGILFQGSAVVNLQCGVISDSQGSSSVQRSGSSTVTASPVAAVGAISGTFPSGTTLLPYSLSQADPYSNLTIPSVPNGCNKKYSLAVGTSDSPNGNNGAKGFCFTDMDVKGTLNLPDDSTILIDGANNGVLSVGAQGTINCTRCTFILTTSGTDFSKVATVNMNGSANINVTAPTTGDYRGMIMIQDKRALFDSTKTNKINGNSNSTLTGAIYFPNQAIDFSGNDGMVSTCLRLVARRLTFIGNSSIQNSCQDFGTDRTITGTQVRLVS